MGPGRKARQSPILDDWSICLFTSNLDAAGRITLLDVANPIPTGATCRTISAFALNG